MRLHWQRGDRYRGSKPAGRCRGAGEPEDQHQGDGKGESLGSGAGAETTGDPATLIFSDMPPVDLPDKVVIQMGL